ncbi:ABC transporter permease subunit [Nakamurella sp. YIM 132087]|uniref:ABC transporter permease subunit n=1 Tax=Nakamurella alba TaxID=2665158 RepID=A0A7K1FEW2_9ACTN|nr:ABC transporter permease [Nakamurella alba]MTD12645.1 ABC transporter permease subunit [Nakamurella alba]
MRYFAGKIGYFLLTAWAAITLNFLIPRLQPGDPAEVIVRKLNSAAGATGALDPVQVQAIRAMIGEPGGNLWTQYLDYLGSLFRGQFGLSFAYYPFPVTQVISQAVWWTVGLIGVTQILSFVLGTVLGAWAAWRRNSRFDSIISIGSTFVGNLQSFWIGLLVLYFFAYTLGWFPASGGYEYTNPGWNWSFAADVLSHAALPALTLMITAPIGFILGMRNTMVQVLGEDFIRLGQAQGLPERKIALGYAARNAMLPSVTNFALSLGALLGGSVLVEQLFDYPGMGRLLAEATANRDFPLMQGILLFIILAVLVANLVADLLYGVLDPRARKER